jgi:hypothetical protein
MELQKRLGVISLFLSLIFILMIIFAFSGVPIYNFLGPLEGFFGVPLYVFIFVSFSYTLYKWFRNMNRTNFKYWIYTCIAGSIVVGSLLYIMIQLADALEHF